MKKLKTDELLKDFNSLREKYQEKTFSGKEIQDLLKKYNFNHVLVNILKKKNVFLSQRIGTSILYNFRKEPLYIGKLEEVIKDYRIVAKRYNNPTKITEEEHSPEEKALELLKAQGYQIRKCMGFDLDTFAKENPELYKKYLVYESC